MGKLPVCSEAVAACAQVTDGAFRHPTPPTVGLNHPQVSVLLLQGI